MKLYKDLTIHEKINERSYWLFPREWNRLKMQQKDVVPFPMQQPYITNKHTRAQRGRR